MTVIRTENLSKAYGGGWGRKRTEALRGLSFEVRAGEVFGFLGPNGAGKTTTIHLLLNFIRPSSGSAFLFDRPATDSTSRSRIGYLPESVNLHDHYRGRRLLDFYASLLDMPRAARERRVAELLKLLGLQDAGDKPIPKYSKGMLQRIGFAQALLSDPDLLVLDEPTSSLDPVGRKEFRDILLELKRRGKTVFISSHILSERQHRGPVHLLQRSFLGDPQRNDSGHFDEARVAHPISVGQVSRGSGRDAGLLDAHEHRDRPLCSI